MHSLKALLKIIIFRTYCQSQVPQAEFLIVFVWGGWTVMQENALLGISAVCETDSVMSENTTGDL